jgi:hypothetical protein
MSEVVGPRREVAAYEFDDGQNKIIAQLGKRMKLVGHVLIAFGGLVMLAGLSSGGRGGFSGVAINAVVFILMGLWTRRAGQGFQNVVKTDGDDINHLMDALDQLRKLYGILYGVAMTAAVIMGLIFVGTMMVAGR